MKVITYNINGIRAALKKGLPEWVAQENPDIICLQEIKVDEAQAPKEIFEELGYHHSWHSAVKKGYSGVATFSKSQPTTIVKGIGIDKYDQEGRVLMTEIEGFSIYNCYFPSGSSGEVRQAFKFEFLRDFKVFMEEEQKNRSNMIVVGDYNIVHTELDIHNPKRKDKPSGYTPEERAWMTDWFQSGFTDAFRFLNPDATEFTWWSYRAGARKNNKGWRIDYVSINSQLINNVQDCYHMNEALHSDHCPVCIELK